ELDRAIFAGRGQRLVVGGNGHAGDPVLMSLQRRLFLGRGDIPQFDYAALTAGRQQLAVGRESHVPDRGLVARQRTDFLPALGVPQLDVAGAIQQRLPARRGQRAAVGREGQRGDPVGVLGNVGLLLGVSRSARQQRNGQQRGEVRAPS